MPTRNLGGVRRRSAFTPGDQIGIGWVVGWPRVRRLRRKKGAPQKSFPSPERTFFRRGWWRAECGARVEFGRERGGAVAFEHDRGFDDFGRKAASRAVFSQIYSRRVLLGPL